MVTAIAVRTALARSVACLVVFFALSGLAGVQSTYDSALTNGIPITNTYTAGGAQATSVVLDKNNGTNLWWMYPDAYEIWTGSGTITMDYTGAGSVATTVNLTGLNIAGVNAYPFFFLGCFETDCIAPPTQAPSFPAQLNTISSMPVDFAYNLSGSDFHGDITFDEWISNTPNSTSPSEIMVMTDFDFGYGYYGTHIETVNVPASVNGAATTLPFTVYYGGGTVYFILDSTQHPYITSGEVQFDLLYFLKEGARIDGATSAYYVQGIEFGTEFGNSATQNYTFTLTKFNVDEEPPGELVLSTNKLAFGTVGVGNSRTRVLRIRNRSAQGVLVGNVSAPAAPFTVVAGGGAFQFSGRQSIPVTVEFKPTGPGPFSSTLTITSNDPAHPSVDV